MNLLGSRFGELAGKYPRAREEFIQYGTAGFRTKADLLSHVLFRMGALASLRSLAKGAQAIGLMITASHNPEPDNGVKLVDPQGEMLEMAWEPIATELANAANDEVPGVIASIVTRFNIDLKEKGSVFIGWDTRSSGRELATAAEDGVSALGSWFQSFGVVTTPMLHFFVASYNEGVKVEDVRNLYFQQLSSSFIKLREQGYSNKNYSPELDFDGANGVGAIAMEEFIPHLKDSLTINIYNRSTQQSNKLNYLCGADYVKSLQKFPDGVEVHKNKRCVSVDGDADRVVYSYIDRENQFHLLDGDRIATLVAGYLMELVRGSGLVLSLGLVQTAYANGNSTKYASEILGVPVACVSTGVKHLHHKATEFDIGVYFEANGHGTVIFSQKAKQVIEATLSDSELEVTQKEAALKLHQVMGVINQTVGDAISDMFLVETVLHARGWNIHDWEAAYTDLPSKLVKVVVKDRNVIETTDAERKCVLPETLQPIIDSLVSQYESGRSFVRPSGTEDIVRVYAEAQTKEMTCELAMKVAQAVFDHAGGVGDRSKM